MMDDYISTDDEVIDDSQFLSLSNDQSTKTKTVISKSYETKMRSLLLSKPNKSLSVNKLRSLLLPDNDEIDDDEYIADSQMEPVSKVEDRSTSFIGNHDAVQSAKEDKYLQYLADYYTKDVTSQDKDIINGHVLRKRNLNQLHIYELDRINYEKITAKMADARYEQSDYDDDHDDHQSDYSNISEDDSANYRYQNTYESNNMESFIPPPDELDKKQDNHNATVPSVFEDSDNSYVIQISSDEDEDSIQILEERILPNNKRTMQTSLESKKKPTVSSKSKLIVNNGNQWGKLKNSKPSTTNNMQKAGGWGFDLSSSDSDDALEDFLIDFHKKVNISKAQNNISEQQLLNVKKQNKQVRTLSNKGIPNKLKDNFEKTPKRKLPNKKTQVLDDFFQAHLEANAAEYQEPDIQPEIRLENSEEISNGEVGKIDISSYFSKQSKDVSKNKSQNMLACSRVYKSLMSLKPEHQMSTVSTNFELTTKQLHTFKVSLFSSEINYDYTKLLDHLATASNINVSLLTNFFDKVAIESRAVLVSLGNEQTKSQMVLVFYKTVCIPLLGFHSLINNAQLKFKEKEIAQKMSNFVVRSLNNLFKVQSIFKDAVEYYDTFTKGILVKTFSKYPNEYKKIINYYKDKGDNFIKYSHSILFKDLRVVVDIDTCLDIARSIKDSTVKKFFLSTCLLSYKTEDVTKDDLLKCLEMYSMDMYNTSSLDYPFDTNFIFVLRSSYRLNIQFFKSNTILLAFRILLKYRSFFIEDIDMNNKVINLFKPSYKGKGETFSQRIQKINMCSVLCCLNINNFILIAKDFLKLLNFKDIENHQLHSYYKKTSVRNEILKDAFEQCLNLHQYENLSVSYNCNKNFYENIGGLLWDDFYNQEWNLLGEKLVNKYSINLFVDFLEELYYRNKQEMISPIKTILKKSIDVDDTVSLIYKFCMKTVLSDTSINPTFIKNLIFGKLFMFFKVCDSVNTYTKVIEKTQSILNYEILDYKGYRTFFKKSAEEISPMDFYYSISQIKLTSDSIISTNVKTKIFVFIKFIFIKWLKEGSYFQEKDHESKSGITYTEKFLEIIKNYILMSKNLLLVATTIVEAVKDFFIECEFHEFVELTNEIRLQNLDTDNLQLHTIFSDIDLPYNKSTYSYFVDLLIKYNIKDKRHVLKEYLSGIRVSKDISSYINEISQNEIGFEALVLYLLKHDIYMFDKIYRNLKTPQALFRTERILIKFLKDRSLNITIDQWDILTDLPSHNQEVLNIKSIIVKYTKKR
ncbi:hypothetical protein ACO0R3_003897 [Hanseniaspora guilliermondii]